MGSTSVLYGPSEGSRKGTDDRRDPFYSNHKTHESKSHLFPETAKNLKAQLGTSASSYTVDQVSCRHSSPIENSGLRFILACWVLPNIHTLDSHVCKDTHMCKYQCDIGVIHAMSEDPHELMKSVSEDPHEHMKSVSDSDNLMLLKH